MSLWVKMRQSGAWNCHGGSKGPFPTTAVKLTGVEKV